MDIDIKELAKTVAESLNLKDFKGDVVALKVVENEFGNIEPGGIGVKKIYGSDEKDDAESKKRDVTEESQRQLLLSNNTIVRIYTESNQKAVDILALYRFIDKYFVDDISFKYEWYALRRFLEKYKLMRDCDNEEFARQMNSKVWFAYSKKPCEANEMNNYNFLNDVQPDKWLTKELPIGGKATKKAVSKIYTTFNNLVMHNNELLGK